MIRIIFVLFALCTAILINLLISSHVSIAKITATEMQSHYLNKITYHVFPLLFLLFLLAFLTFKTLRKNQKNNPPEGKK